MNEHPDEYLYPLERPLDAWTKAQSALAYAVAKTTDFYVDDIKEHDTAIRFTIYDYRSNEWCDESWHSIEAVIVDAMPMEKLQQHFIDYLNTLPRWGEDNGATGKTIQGDPPQ